MKSIKNFKLSLDFWVVNFSSIFINPPKLYSLVVHPFRPFTTPWGSLGFFIKFSFIIPVVIPLLAVHSHTNSTHNSKFQDNSKKKFLFQFRHTNCICRNYARDRIGRKQVSRFHLILLYPNQPIGLSSLDNIQKFWLSHDTAEQATNAVAGDNFFMTTICERKFKKKDDDGKGQWLHCICFSSVFCARDGKERWVREVDGNKG